MMPWDQRLARLLARPIGRLGIGPNAVTTFGLANGLVAGFLFAQGDPTLSTWAALVFMYAVFNDHLDGEVARLTGKCTRFGEFYDHVGSGVCYVSMFVGVGYGLQDGVPGLAAIALGVLAGGSVTAIFLIRTWVEQTRGRDSVRHFSFAGFEVEDILYLVGPITWLGGLEPFLMASGVGTPLFLIYVLYDTFKTQKVRAREGA